MSWWQREIVEAGKLPLLVALASFVLTFLVTRLVTRLIRAGRGPFRNITSGGVHLHHVVPGILLMVGGGFGTAASSNRGLVPSISALLFGVGAGLVLDEFALVLHMDDVYWSEHGRKSVEAVVLTTALGAMLLLGFLPFGPTADPAEEQGGRLVVALTVAWHVLLSLVAVAKGKLRLAVLGVCVPLVGLVAAVRLARPGSWWANRFYARRPRASRRSAARAARHDARWSGPRRRLHDLLGGAPNR
ncbi:hypothetical protein ACFWRV_01690 [Streptomyces sp. NPDC058576]|uniref:hypothetical protein n=1 Tax=Streptomyces sp. NPDC058576 TaxID=3346547 RepID=UPI003668CEFE